MTASEHLSGCRYPSLVDRAFSDWRTCTGDDDLCPCEWHRFRRESVTSPTERLAHQWAVDDANWRRRLRGDLTRMAANAKYASCTYCREALRALLRDLA